ncbi:S8 family serine peptidase [Dokdonella sp. MW10]|uniref:S8 family serine peptidase n=1 Tax=Dokdonella sp. MW10 TaxID=2992926 RepID=UPI003F7EF31D
MKSRFLVLRPLAAAVLLATAGVHAAPLPSDVAFHAVAPDAVAALREQPGLLLLQSGAFDPLHERLRFTGAPVAVRADARYGIVQFAPGREAEARAAIAKAGAAIVGHLPNHAFQVRADAGALARVGADAAVRWSGAYDAGFKLARGLLDGSVAARHAPSADVELEIHGFRGEPLERLVDALRATGVRAGVLARATALDLPSFRVAVHAADLRALLVAASGVDGIAWIEPYLAPTLGNLDSAGPIQSNQASCASPDTDGNCGALDPARATWWRRGLTGHGQIVAIADSGLDRNEASFSGLDVGSGANVAVTDADDPAPVPPAIGATYPDRKVYAYWVQPGATAYDNNAFCGGFIRYHGTHVSGTVAGDAPPFASPGVVRHDDGDGMAPGAQILFQDLGDDTSGCLSITDYGATLAQAYAGGAGIHSNSWGTNSTGFYIGHDQRADAAAWLGEDMLTVVAAGNSGSGPTTTGSPGNAKNVLTVGSTRHGNLSTTSSFSSRGPTEDGRRKPDIMAPGEMIRSALGNGDNGATVQPPLLQALSGTSMATPTVSGGAALLRQYFSDGWYPRGRATPGERFEAPGVLLKAALLNGTAPISTNWPSHNVGWGRLWLDNSAYFEGDARGMRHWMRENGAGLETGDVDAFDLDIAAGAELRVTLAWFDPEASLGASPTLVNDLDLVVVSPSGQTFRGNDFFGGQSRPGTTADRINTVEHVRVVTPAAGRWSVRVDAHAVPGNGRPTSHRQGYALVVGARMGVLGDRLFADGFAADDPSGAAAPATLALAGNDDDGVRVSAVAVGGASHLQLYRADGTCAAADRARFRFVGQSATAEVTDARSQGGSTYAYRMRTVRDGVEGPLSEACVDVVSADACSMSLAFTTDSLVVTDARHPVCAVDLAWQAAQASCPGESVGYRVLRDTSPLFTSPVLVGTTTTATFTDTDVGDGVPVYYQVEAHDGAGNVSRSHVVGATPAGADDNGFGTWVDDVDTRTTLASQWPWSITNAAASNGSFAYRSAAGSAYPSETCAAITTPTLRLAPGAPLLRYAARYQLETEWDGVVVEISTDDGATWTPIAPEGGYPSSFAQTQDPPVNACGYAASQGAFNGTSTGFATGQFVEVAHDLAAYAGQDVRLRWRLSTDPAYQEAGFFLDNLRIGAALPGTCSASR